MNQFSIQSEKDLPKVHSLGVAYALRVANYLRKKAKMVMIITVFFGAIYFAITFFADRRIDQDCGDQPGMHEPEKRWVMRSRHGPNIHLHPSYFELILDGRSDQIVNEYFRTNYPERYDNSRVVIENNIEF